ncbi:MAG: class I tRNA ligase family protein [Kibdelosporangium sp.]
MSRFYVTTTVPAGDALELVQADVLARHRRLRGDRVRFLAGPGAQALRAPLALSFNFTAPDFTAPDFTAPDVTAPDSAVHETGKPTRALRLSGYAGRLHDLISSGELRIEPATCRDEVLAHIAAGLPDCDIERPGYITSLGPDYRRWWAGAERRAHVISRDTLFFHAVHWPALLLSEGVPLPTDVLVHAATDVDAADLVERYGADAVRWCLLRETDIARLVPRANADLANDLGRLVDQATAMVHRYRHSRPPDASPEASELAEVCRGVPERVHEALTVFDFGAATTAVWRLVRAANDYAAAARPWDLARAERDGDTKAGDRLDTTLATLLMACRVLAYELTPFLPTLATRIAEQCISLTGELAPTQPLYPKLR